MLNFEANNNNSLFDKLFSFIASKLLPTHLSFNDVNFSNIINHNQIKKEKTKIFQELCSQYKNKRKNY